VLKVLPCRFSIKNVFTFILIISLHFAFIQSQSSDGIQGFYKEAEYLKKASSDKNPSYTGGDDAVFFTYSPSIIYLNFEFNEPAFKQGPICLFKLRSDHYLRGPPHLFV